MSQKLWFRMARNDADSSATIDIFEEIGFWGVSAREFIAHLRALGSVSRLTVNIDCPGGDCNEGFTIFDALVALNVTIEVNIIGLSASMASVVMLAAQTIRIAENGRVMVHRVTAGAMGNADELDAAAKTARQFEDRIVNLYMARTKADEETIRGYMKADMGTWFFGQEAVDAGFADEVMTGTKASAFKQRWAGMFTMLPSALFDTSGGTVPKQPEPTPPPSAMTEAEMQAKIDEANAAKAEAEKKAKEAEDAKAKAESDAAAAKAKADEKIADAEAAKAKAEKDAADAKAKADASEDLGKRLEKLESMAKTGVLGASKGSAAVEHPGGGPSEDPPKLSGLQLIAKGRKDAAAAAASAK